jgi:hypothetical protein
MGADDLWVVPNRCINPVAAVTNRMVGNSCWAGGNQERWNVHEGLHGQPNPPSVQLGTKFGKMPLTTEKL